MSKNPVTIVDEVFALYELYGDDDYIGEPVSQLEHMSQAASLAEAEGFEDEVILAAFFHDIGHLCTVGPEADTMDGFGNVDHEKIGGDYLRKKGFSNRMAALVESHVVAKRYLTYKFPAYYQQLSEASKATLQFQGGVMTKTEADEFEKNPDAELIIKMRHWDDLAKETAIPVSNIHSLKQKAINHLIVNQKIIG